MISAGISLGLTIAKGVSGIFGANSQKKAAERQANIQRGIVNQEYSYNKDQLIKSTTYNLEANFSNISSAMFNLSKEYVNTYSSVNIMSSMYGNGLSYTSSIDDMKNSISSEYQAQLENLVFTRGSTELQLINEYNSNMYQLDMNRYKAIVGIDTTLQSVKNQANQNMINNVIGTALDVASISDDAGGFWNIFK